MPVSNLVSHSKLIRDWIWDSASHSVQDSVAYSIQDWISAYGSHKISYWVLDSVLDSIPDKVSDSTLKPNISAKFLTSLQIAVCWSQIAICILQFAYCILQFADCRLQILVLACQLPIKGCCFKDSVCRLSFPDGCF